MLTHSLLLLTVGFLLIDRACTFQLHIVGGLTDSLEEKSSTVCSNFDLYCTKDQVHDVNCIHDCIKLLTHLWLSTSTCTDSMLMLS